MKIHPTALIDKKARLAENVEIGPYSIIGPNVQIGAWTRIGQNVVIEGWTTIGERCSIFTGACIGSIPQDLKYKGKKSFLKIGNNNTIREYATLNPGTEENSITSIGNGNLLMAYSHIAHDCEVANGCIIANSGTLAGHVELEDNVIIGGLSAVHQFVRVGKLAIIGGCSKVVQDVVPFSTIDGHPGRVYGLNVVGLRRSGVSKEVRQALKKTFRLLFFSGLSLRHSVERIKKEIGRIEEIEYLLRFIKNSKRGISRGIRE